MSVFPFHLIDSSGSLVFYLVVYVLTLVLHAFFMTYVLAGSAYLAWATVFSGDQSVPRAQQPAAGILREWLPFMLSGAITAGVAPLLFVQIIYRQEFYTANLLLGWRWMLVIPALIIAFYLLYVIKSRVVSQWSLLPRIGLVLTISLSFLFVALCWTTNHLLQLQRAEWASIYESSKIFRHVTPLLARLSTWFAGAFSSMAVLLGWQLRYYATTHDGGEPVLLSLETRRLARLVIGSLVVATICGVIYVWLLPPEQSQPLLQNGGPWWWLLAVGVMLQLFGWVQQFRAERLCRPRMWLVSTGNAFVLIAAGFLRELLRFPQVDSAIVAKQTQQAIRVGGFGLFLGFTLLNLVLIGVCLKIVNRRLNS